VQYPGQQLQGQQPQGQQFPGQQYPSQQVLGQQAPGGQYPGVHYSPAAGYAPAAQPNANYSFPPGQYDDGGAHLAGTKPLKRKRRKGPIVALVLVLLLLAVLAYPVGLIMWANGQINHIEALSGRANTPGTTFLLVGTDTRGDDDIYHELDLVDGTTGSRADSVILLHQPRSGPTAMISLPRDTFVQIPGVGGQKLNAAYAFGGPELLVATVENLTGLTIDHFVGIGMGGLANLVDAVGGVELCMDRDVDDWESQLVWEAGCHVADGRTALAFARMRMSDPLGDIGRVQRQREVIAAIVDTAADPSIILRPTEVTALASAGLGSVKLDDSANIYTVARLGLAFRAASGPGGVTGTPPISSLDFRPGGIGSAVQLDPQRIDQFWEDLANGDLEPGIHPR
jgi:LCP family protein required for cell wall assembly